LVEIGQRLIGTQSFGVILNAVMQERKNVKGEHYRTGYPERDKGRAIRCYHDLQAV
jgi:hypothetical protein